MIMKKGAEHKEELELSVFNRAHKRGGKVERVSNTDDRSD